MNLVIFLKLVHFSWVFLISQEKLSLRLNLTYASFYHTFTYEQKFNSSRFSHDVKITIYRVKCPKMFQKQMKVPKTSEGKAVSSAGVFLSLKIG